MRTVIIGLGNPLVSDDAVGVRAARLLSARLKGATGVVVKELYGGGLRLMEAMAGFERAVVIDAMVTGAHAPGSIVEVELSSLKGTRNLASGHDTGLFEALEVGRAAGLHIPDDIRIIGIEAVDVINFGENLSPVVEAALPQVMEMVLDGLSAQKGVS